MLAESHVSVPPIGPPWDHSSSDELIDVIINIIIVIIVVIIVQFFWAITKFLSSCNKLRTYVYVTGTGLVQLFSTRKKGVEQEFLWKSCSLRGHQLHISSHKKTTGASSALFGAYLKISA
jgi:hypothetical protein